jgi:phosphatidylglycerophosphate synthase
MNKEYTASLKSIETENIIDLFFYRPIGYQIARVLKHTRITPNMVTIFSIFVGAGTGFMFYLDNLTYTVIGILLLVSANILDCVDGQLARLTGIKSKIGRILDGIAGEIWFTSIYIFLALRLANAYGTAWFFIPATISGFSHMIQANITDYYKTLHLYFESKEKGKEFQNKEQIREQRQEMKTGLEKFIYSIYVIYTGVQEKLTPALQQLLECLHTRYGEDFPEHIRLNFRQKSSRLMKQCIDFLTFNGRTIVLFIVVLSGYVWIYFVYEIVILNIFLFVAIKKHEKICCEIFTEIV